MGFFTEINLSNQRGKDESYENYKERQRRNNKRIKIHLKGEQVWDSRTQGTKRNNNITNQ